MAVVFPLVLLYQLVTVQVTEFYSYSQCHSTSGIKNLTSNDFKNRNIFHSSNSVYCLNDTTYKLNFYLKISNVDNIIFIGNKTGIIMESKGIILVSNSSNITFHSLNITKYGYEETGDTSAFILKNCNDCTFSEIIFSGNKSTRAINMSENSVVEITDSDFYRGHAENGGVVYAVSSILIFNGKSHFESNTADLSGGCIYSIESTLIFQNKVTFFSNLAGLSCEQNLDLTFDKSYAACSGGVLYLDSISRVVLEANSILNFEENTALYGGCIFVNDSTLSFVQQCQKVSLDYLSCFFENSSASASLNFTNDLAKISGSHIYGGALEHCKAQIDNHQELGLDYLTNITENHTPSTHHISSAPLKLCFCGGDDLEVNCSIREREVNVMRGKNFGISVVAVGQLESPVPSNIVHISRATNMAHPSSHWSESTPQSTCHNISYSMETSDKKITLILYPEGCNSMAASLTVQIHLSDCPPGFQLSNKTCKCDDRLMKIIDEESCNIQTSSVKRKHNYWIKFDHNMNQSLKVQYATECFPPYCNMENFKISVNSNSTNPNDQCGKYRTGVSCGECEEGYGLQLSNFECEKCHNRYLSLLALFAFAGVTLITILFLLHMTIAKGTINGLIFYANVVSICSSHFFPYQKNPKPILLLQVFIAWINLDFGVPICFHSQLQHYSYTWLQFVFPVYLWLLIGMIIVGCRLSSRFSSLLGTNPTAVLATVTLMSFTKLLQTPNKLYLSQ